MMEDLSNYEFQQAVQFTKIADAISVYLFDDMINVQLRKKPDVPINRNQYRKTLKNCFKFIDKKTFLQFRAG